MLLGSAKSTRKIGCAGPALEFDFAWPAGVFLSVANVLLCLVCVAGIDVSSILVLHVNRFYTFCVCQLSGFIKMLAYSII